MTPSAWADERMKLAGEYSRMSEQLEQILERKPSVWAHLRISQKSDKATDRLWELTPDGLEEMKLHLRMRANDKMQSALSSRIRVAENEAKHIW